MLYQNTAGGPVFGYTDLHCFGCVKSLLLLHHINHSGPVFWQCIKIKDLFTTYSCLCWHKSLLWSCYL